MPPVLPSDDVAKWSSDSESPPYECGPLVSPHVSMDEAAVTQNGQTLEAASGVCLLIAMYVPELKLGAVIHLNRNLELYTEQQDLIQNVFTEFPQFCKTPHIVFVSNKKVEADLPEMATQAKTLIRDLASGAILQDAWVNSPDDPAVDLNTVDSDLIENELPMSVEVRLSTSTGEMVIDDDFGVETVITLV